MERLAQRLLPRQPGDELVIEKRVGGMEACPTLILAATTELQKEAFTASDLSVAVSPLLARVTALL